MTVTETVLVFVGIPLLVVLAIFGLVYGTSAVRSRRYRPGRPYATAPVWFLAEEEPGKPSPTSRALASTEPVHHGEVGGASDNW